MIERPKILEKSEELSDMALCFLHYKFANSDKFLVNLSVLSLVIPGTRPHLIEFRMEDLVSSGCIERIENEFETKYKISRFGIGIVEGWEDDYYSGIANKLRTEYFQDSEVDGIQDLEEEPWGPLPIEKDDPKYAAAVDAAEDALNIIEASNGYADSDPEERNQIVWTIRSGLEVLKDGFPTKSQIRALLVEPFTYLARKFADASIGEAAKSAVAKLIELLS